jgi:DNA-binding MarR family transcriptional regulator
MILAASQDEQSTAELNDPLSGSLCHELRKTSVAVMAAMSGEFGKWNLKSSEANLLKYVGANPGCTQSDIARAHRNNATNLVSLIARLERDGLLERTPAGGRAIALSISAKGATLLAKVDTGFRRLEDQLGDSLTDEQRAQFTDALRKICKAACHYGKA